MTRFLAGFIVAVAKYLNMRSRLQFKEERSIGRESIFDGTSTIASYPAGNYLLEAKRKGDTAHFYLMCDRNGAVNPLIFKKELPIEALDELQAIIKKYNLAAINGSSLWNSALGTMLKLVVCYDSDEQLSVYAEGGVSLSYRYLWEKQRI